MNAADTSASSAMADWTPLAVVLRSCTTAEMETFISDVSTTSTNIAIDNRIASARLRAAGRSAGGAPCRSSWVMGWVRGRAPAGVSLAVSMCPFTLRVRGGAVLAGTSHLRLAVGGYAAHGDPRQGRGRRG